MSSEVMLGLADETELDIFTNWIAAKWRSLWYWYADWHEAREIAHAAIITAETTWKPDAGSNRTTWAANNARLEYLTRHSHEKRMRRANFRPRDDLVVVHDDEEEHGNIHDILALHRILQEKLDPRLYYVLRLRSFGYTLDETSLTMGLCRERVRQLENKAIKAGRRIMVGVMARNRCNEPHELY